jgi:hypothetical protein
LKSLALLSVTPPFSLETTGFCVPFALTASTRPWPISFPTRTLSNET